MTLSELSSELFLYLVVFGRKIVDNADIRIEDVANDLEMIFARMDKKAESDPVAGERFGRMRKVLVVAADGVITGSNWERALDYRMGHLLENKFYQSNEGGDFFYDQLQKVPAENAEEREIFFTALALGFQGRLARQPEVRMDEKKKLYRGLPAKVIDGAERITPQAYEHTDERDCTVPPVARFGRYAIILAGILLVLLILGRTVYHMKKSQIETVVEELQPAPRAGEGGA